MCANLLVPVTFTQQEMLVVFLSCFLQSLGKLKTKIAYTRESSNVPLQ